MAKTAAAKQATSSIDLPNKKAKMETPASTKSSKKITPPTKKAMGMENLEGAEAVKAIPVFHGDLTVKKEVDDYIKTVLEKLPQAPLSFEHLPKNATYMQKAYYDYFMSRVSLHFPENSKIGKRKHKSLMVSK